MADLEFDWDTNNIKHLFEDHPQRKLSIKEIESVYYDNDAIVEENTLNNRGERKYVIKGLSNQNRILFVMFVIRDGHIRPFSAREDRRAKREYHGRGKK
jgi:uncharacterized DUF497 family protein